MPEIAFTDFQDTIYKVDLETLIVTKLFETQCDDIAMGPNGVIFVAGRPSGEIRRFLSVPSDPSSYEYGTLFYDDKDIHISNIRLRPVDSLGNYRIYFSESYGAGGDGRIYYLDESMKPVLYYIVEINKIPNYYKCDNTYSWPYWAGDFAFDDQNNLYLSNGNIEYASIYKVSGASLDNVSGEPVRIYTAPDGLSILGMQFVSPDKLYFSVGRKIWRLSLTGQPPYPEFIIEYTPPAGDTWRQISGLSLTSLWWPYGVKKTVEHHLYPGITQIGVNRRKQMVGLLEQLRNIAEADVVAIMGHRMPGADYPSIHPPLSEVSEPYCPIRQMVAPTPGAAAGDRIRYSQWVDSMYFAPATPYWRSYWGAFNCRGGDPGTLSGRQIMEARERDIEVYTKIQMDTEMFDPARSAMRGCTVHGHSLRLEENGLMFDMLKRVEMGRDGKVYQVKDQVGIPLDRKIDLGRPMSDSEAKKRTTIFREDGVPLGGKVGARKYDEAVEALHHMWELRSRWGFRPE